MNTIKDFLVRRYFSTTSGARNEVYRLTRILSKVSFRTFPIAVVFSKIYLKTNNRFAAEELVRLYERHEQIRLNVAKELFRFGSHNKVVRLFSGLDFSEIDQRYGIPIVELLGDSYFSLRKFNEALLCYEYVISRVLGAKLSRIKSAECYYHLHDIKRSSFRLKQYKDRFGSNSRVVMLEKMLDSNTTFNKAHEFKNHLVSKYGLKIHHKVKVV